MTQVLEVTGGSVKVAFADQDYTGSQPSAEAAKQGVTQEIVKLSEARTGFVLLPKRWVVERTFGWQARFRHLSRDYESLPDTLAALPLPSTCSTNLFNMCVKP
jgi:transposase